MRRFTTLVPAALWLCCPTVVGGQFWAGERVFTRLAAELWFKSIRTRVPPGT